MIEVILYSREDCHLCEQALTELESLQEDVPHTLVVMDVDSDARLRKNYGFEVPVVEVGPYQLKAPFSRRDLLVMLSAAKDRVEQIAAVDKAIENGKVRIELPWTRSDRIAYWLSRHYLALFNFFVLIYLGFPVLAPVLMRAGATVPASWIYRAYGNVCHELAYRSWFLFGEQLAYPRSTAGVDDLISYGQAIGLDEGDLWSARVYYGDDIIGYKVALCQRDFAIYVGILLFGLIFATSGRRLKAMPWYIWILVGIAPIGLDGVSQLVSQPPFNFLPYRESTPLLRTITGGLFGFLTAWFGYPMVEESMAETREYMKSKFARVQKQRQVLATQRADNVKLLQADEEG